MTHFTRLLDLTSADEQYTTALAQNLSACVLRPRVESSLTMDERHSYRLIRDLFAHKDVIFGELKRQSSALGISSSTSRPRAISTDESNRRAAMEARQRAIASKSRATSPAPRQRHRRDRSSGASESTRFPINVTSPQDRRTPVRTSLDVPNESPSSTENPTVDTQVTEEEVEVANAMNGTALVDSPSEVPESTTSSGSISPPLPETVSDDSPTPTPTPAPVYAEFDKRSSIPRSSARSGRKPGLGSLSSFPTNPTVVATGTESNRSSLVEEPKGVTLEDKPMDD